MTFRSLQCVLHVLPVSSSPIYHWQHQVTGKNLWSSAALCNALRPPDASIFLDPNIIRVVNALFSDTFNLSPATMRLHPYAFKLERRVPVHLLRENFSALLLEAAHYAALTSDTVVPSVLVFKCTIPETAPLPTSGNNQLTPASRVLLKKLIIANFPVFMRPRSSLPCKVCGPHSGAYEEHELPGCASV
jgi:hypothetical protein